MASRFSWLNEGLASPRIQQLLGREPGLIQRQLAAEIRALLHALAFGRIWSQPRWTMDTWRAQRVSPELFRPLTAWGTSLLSSIPNAELSLSAACRILTSAWRELASLPVPQEPRRVVHPRGAMTVAQWHAAPAYPGKEIVRTFVTGAREQPPPLLAGLLLHGSAADGRVCQGFSDLDLHAVVDTPRDSTGEAVESLLAWLITSQSTLHAFNHYCHHGIMLTLDLDRRGCAESGLPSALLNRGVWAIPPAGSFAYAPDTLGTLRVIAGFESFFDNRSLRSDALAGPFDALWYTASILLLPLLLWQLERGESLYKPEVLDRCDELLSPESVAALRLVEQARLRIGDWITHHPAPAALADAWPGAALHCAREESRFTAKERALLQIDKPLLLAGKQLWEEVANRALQFVELRSRSVATMPREQFFFAWPAQAAERPQPLPLTAYDAARAEFLDRAARHPDVRSVYEIGNVGAPGLSDLDFLVIIAPRAHGIPRELRLDQFPPDLAAIMNHEALFLSEDALPDLPIVFPLLSATRLHGSANMLPCSFDFPADLIAPMLTRHTAVKYPNDLVYLVRQPRTRWTTLLAYANSFRHLERCFHFLSIPFPDTAAACIAMSTDLRERFTHDSTASLADLRAITEQMLDASVDILFALEHWWRERSSAVAERTNPIDCEVYRDALFTAVATASAPPPLPPMLHTIVQSCATLSPSALPRISPYLMHLQRFVTLEAAHGRTPNYYIHYAG